MIYLFRLAFAFFNLKGLERNFSSDPSCKDDKVRFATIPLKDLSDQVCKSINVYNLENCNL